MEENFEIVEFLETLFNTQELKAFDCVTNSTVDVEKLKKTGDVTVVKETEDGFVTEAITYTSFDGKVQFTKIIGYPEAKAYEQEITRLNELIQAAVAREDYELAAKYKSEKEAFKG